MGQAPGCLPRGVLCHASRDAATVTQSNETSVTFTVPYKVNFGEKLKLVGSGQEFGEWDATRGLPLTWSEGDLWTAEVPLKVDSVEFKCVVFNKALQQVVRWEDGPNRQLTLPSAADRLLVSCTWGKTADMILEVEPEADVPPAHKEVAAIEEVAEAAFAHTNGASVVHAVETEDLEITTMLASTSSSEEEAEEQYAPAVEAKPLAVPAVFESQAASQEAGKEGESSPASGITAVLSFVGAAAVLLVVLSAQFPEVLSAYGLPKVPFVTTKASK